MISIIFIVIATAFLHASWGLTDECTRVRTPCDAQQLLDQTNNVDPCVYTSKWVSCAASAISAAAASGTCDPLTVSAYRSDVFQNAQVYASYCPNFVIPATLQQDSCATELGTCGTKIMQAYSGKTREEICGYISEFYTCMTTETQACIDKQNVERLSLEQLYEYQTCEVIPSSLTPQCIGVLTRCNTQQMIDQVNKVEDCQIGINYFQCVATALQNAGQSGICGPLALYTNIYNQGLEANVYVENCPNFHKPAYLTLDYCSTEIGNCGFNNFFNAYSANRTGDLATACSELSALKDCMTMRTGSCQNRTLVNNLVNRELTYFQQTARCTPLWSTECESVKNPCNQQQLADQSNKVDACTTESRYLTCLANAYSQAEAGQGRCSQIQLSTYTLAALQEAQTYKTSCPALQTPNYLTSLTACETQMATCGPSLKNLASSSTNDDACRNLAVFLDCLEKNTPSCSNRHIVLDIAWKADKDYCTGNVISSSTTTQPTTTTQKPQPETSTTTATTSTKTTATTTTPTITSSTTTTTLATTTTPTTTTTAITKKPTNNNNGNTGDSSGSAQKVPLLITLVLTILLCMA